MATRISLENQRKALKYKDSAKSALPEFKTLLANPNDFKERILIYEAFGKLDVFYDEEGEIWFYGVKAASILGYSNPGKAVIVHTDKSDRKALKYKAFPKTGKAFRTLWEEKNDFSDKTLINEAGLYSLIFLSKLPSAKEFRSWVTHTVLPSIRKTGDYISEHENLDAGDFGFSLLIFELISTNLRRSRETFIIYHFYPNLYLPKQFTLVLFSCHIILCKLI